MIENGSKHHRNMGIALAVSKLLSQTRLRKE